MTATSTQPRMTGRRVLFGINAVVALIGLTVGFILTVLGTYPSLNTNPTMLGNPDQGVLGRVFDYFTYFTIWSNILVAVVSIMLFLRPDRDSFAFRVLRLDSILMITVTGIIYNVVLAGSAKLQGLEVMSNLFDHVLTPVVTVLIWLFVGPRGWISWRAIGAALILPIGWLGFALIRGAFIGAYPYGFLDVATYGYGTVLTNVLGVVAFAIVLSLILWGIDWVIRRIAQRTSTA
jgi:hypothetical protein